MELNNDNYYGLEANREYWSVSQFKQFMKCEAEGLASLNGEYKREETTSLLVGSYVDSYIEGTLDEFKNTHPQLFSTRGATKGELKKEYKDADEIIKRIESDDLFMKFLSGEKQKILTAEINGIKWKTKMDSFIPNVCIADLKVLQNLANVAKWRYDIQGAVYQKVAEANGYGKLPFYLCIVTKENPADIAIVQIPQNVLDQAYAEVENSIYRFDEIKNGNIEPDRCEKCEYCRMTKKASIVSYNDFL